MPVSERKKSVIIGRSKEPGNKRPHLTMRWGQKVKIRKEERCPISFPMKYYANYEPTSPIV
jgi:hypothetical protein